VVFSPAPGFWQSDFSPDQSHHRPSCTTKTAAVRFGPPALQPRGQRHCHGRPTAPCPKHSAPIIAMKAPPRRLVALSPATLPPSIHHGITSIGRAGGGASSNSSIPSCIAAARPSWAQRCPAQLSVCIIIAGPKSRVKPHLMSEGAQSRGGGGGGWDVPPRFSILRQREAVTLEGCQRHTKFTHQHIHARVQWDVHRVRAHVRCRQ